MAQRRVFSLPIPLIALLAVAPLANATCYVAAYGLVGEQDGWNACPGTATSAGGVETCCMPGSKCGEDSLCHIPDSKNPGNNAWYQAGCTDPDYTDPVCRNSCVNYTQTYVQWEDDTQLWMCCGDGGCNGTVTDTTFQAVSPGDWKAITASSSSASSSVSTSKTSSATGTSSTKTKKKHNLPSSAAFKPTPTASKGADAVSSSSYDRPAGLSPGAKAGMGVGIPLAALALIAALIAIFMFRRREPRAQPLSEKSATEWTPPASAPSTEVSGESKWSELPISQVVYELPGESGSIYASKRYKQGSIW